MAESDETFLERLSETPCGSWYLTDHDRLFALARRGAAAQWRPIQTAPSKGTYLEYQPPHQDGKIMLHERVVICGEGGSVRKSTHWMPLPIPPQETDNG